MKYLLKKSDEVRIIAPSYSGKMIPAPVWEMALKRLTGLGFKVSFGKHVKEVDLMESTSIENRLNDLHEAFADKSVKGIICAIGGYNSNFLLDKIDWEILKKYPKFFGGMSDITVLGNAIYTMTGLKTYQMPNFRNFGQKYGFEYTMEYFVKEAMENDEVLVKPSKEWSDDRWTKNQEKRKFVKNKGWWVLNEGRVDGVVVGGNLCSLNLLQGTKYMPDIRNKILFIEDDSMSTAGEFSRNLRSLMQIEGALDVKGFVLGRFQKKTKMLREQLEMIIGDIPELKNKPILANVDFGHTDPKITWVIGGEVLLDIKKINSELVLK
ncbi:hypothetical protein A2572_02335 [Candidatus Collierbacteria bacterium RIFOXYD1_FULL_40_9]|uniref:Peptidase S66 n=1 Tax=Candidatus Collierbacteria bacterium RIFOXYD1_FULL_40_9 TaxID=1817731 RepID=A0A1F5FNX1_9BACT|nr:MAG: hypothetical protein A2572_02335 [Candidatus Collierbacteria bacterium RIFOXYD1_FULL_40_9]